MGSLLLNPETKFKLSMSIGKGLDLKTMLNQALEAYVNLLDCIGAFVYQCKIHLDQKYPVLIAKYPEILHIDTNIISEFNTQFPVLNCEYVNDYLLYESNDSSFSYLFCLLGFGYFILFRKEKFTEDELILIEGLNVKLSTASVACLQNQQLKTSEKKYNDLSELFPEIILETDLKGKVRYFNKIAQEKLGFKQEDIRNGISIFDFLYKVDQRKAKMVFEEVIKNSNLPPRNYTAKPIKNSPFPVIVYANHIIEDQKMVGIRYVMIDIKHVRESEFELQKNLEQQELLSEVALELNLLTSFEKRINSILDRIGQHTGVSRVYIFEDLKDGETTSNTFEWCNEGILSQKKDLQGIPYALIPSWKKLLISKGRVFSQNIWELPQDLIDILEPQNIKSIVVYPLYVNGLYYGFIGFDECIRNKKWIKSELELLRTLSGIISNAYERKIAEASLKESEEKNRAIVQSIPDDLLHIHRDGTILSVKKSTVKTKIAFDETQIVGNNLKDVFPPDVANSIFQEIQKCLVDGFNIVEYKMLTEEGIESNCEARISNMNSSEVILLSRDISEQKRYEKSLKEERDKANEANRAKSEFLANMSHEIRTPMNAILGFSEALVHKLENESHKRMIKSILSSGNLLLSLLNDILDLSKIEAGKLEVSPQPTNLGLVIEEIKLLFVEKAKIKGIDIFIEIDEGFPPVILLDEIRIKQVIFNLVGNALKFTHQGYIKMHLAFEYKEDFLGHLFLSVIDTGIGVPKNQQDAIFEVFRQQNGQDNRKYGGAGLGLTISKRLVEKMNGIIKLESEPGEGSNFSVELPDVKVSENYIPEVDERYKALEHIKFKPASVMIVDDVNKNIEIIENHLYDLGFTVFSAESGYIALEILKFNKPDIILLDLRMPNMDGSEVAKRIKADKDLCNIPIVAYTASVFGIDNNNEFKNFDNRLFKPVRKVELIGVLAEYIEYEEVVFDKGLFEKEVDSDKESKGVNISDDVRKILPQINEELEKHFKVLWNEIKDSLVLFKIEEFATNLMRFSKSYDIPHLIDYCSELLVNIENIDLEAIHIQLSLFPKYINELKQVEYEN